MIDLLRQRLDRVETEQVEGDTDDEHGGGGAAQHGLDGEAGDDREGGHPGEARCRVPREAAQPAPHDGTGGAGARAGVADAHPRRGSGSLAAQLTAQQDDGAQVLHGDGEVQLRHEVGAAVELLRSQPIGEQQRQRGDDEDGGDGEHVDRAGAHAPHRQAADPVARSRPAPRDRRRLGGEQHGGERRGDPTRDAEGMDDDGNGDEGEAGERRRGPRTGGPRCRRAGQPARGELSGDRPDHRAGERHRPHPLADRAQQHLAARDRGEQQVAGITALQRDRPSVAAAAQPDGDSGDGDEADHAPRASRPQPRYRRTNRHTEGAEADDGEDTRLTL